MPDVPSRAKVEVFAVLKDAATGETIQVTPAEVTVNPKYAHPDGGVDVQKWEGRHAGDN